MGKSNLFFALLLSQLLTLALFSSSAMWYDALGASARLNTARDCVVFVDYFCSDVGPDPQLTGFSNPEGKDAATCLVELGESSPNRPDRVEVFLNNAYPGYSPRVILEFRNVGTMPVRFCGASISGPGAEALKVDVVAPGIGTVYNPGEGGSSLIRIAVRQEAREKSTYGFQVELCFKPWYLTGRLEFTSWKALAYEGVNPKGKCLYESGRANFEDNGTSARIRFSEFAYGWGWIGLVVSNSAGGDVELLREMLEVKIVEGELSKAVVLLYGPFSAPGTSGVWDRASVCEMRDNLVNSGDPFPWVGSKDGVVLKSNEKAVVWVYVEGPPGPVELEIRVR